MKPGCYTALVTPFMDGSLDIKGIKKLIDFQLYNGVTGIVILGTTGESPTISKKERNKIIKLTAKAVKNRCLFVVGSGSNSTLKALDTVKYAEKSGADAVLLVDPYYNSPSSMEIRREYIAPIAKASAKLNIIPYLIPGRTGTQLFPEDVAMLFDKYPNVNAVKDATGNIDNMRRIRLCCGKRFSILSGDDFMLFKMMSDPNVTACGAVSAVANIVPGAISTLTSLISRGELNKAKILTKAIEPLFKIVTVETVEETLYGNILCRARNPLPLKTLMSVLGMPSGQCRQPLGKMSEIGFRTVVNIAKLVQSRNPELFIPIVEFFGIDVVDRLRQARYMNELFYSSY